MTAISYRDCEATSPGGRFTLEARSPHNGSIPYRNGRWPSEDEFELSIPDEEAKNLKTVGDAVAYIERAAA